MLAIHRESYNKYYSSQGLLSLYILNFSLLMYKLRLEEVMGLAQGHMSN